MVDKKFKKLIGQILSWVFGILFLIVGLLFLLGSEFVMTLGLIIISLILIPPTSKFIFNIVNVKESKIIKTILIIIILMVIPLLSNSKTTTSSQTSIPIATKPYDLEMSMKEIVNIFSGLSEIQQEEKMKELMGKRIKTSIYASRIDKATLSTQYVVSDMYQYPYSLTAYAKAFFPKEEKDKLLTANIGDTIIFSGEFVSYREGAYTSTVEFTNSKFIGVKNN